MADSTEKPKVRRAKKTSEFPLYVHKASGYWCKTIRKKRIYFEKVANDPNGQSSLTTWLDNRDDLLAGRNPRRKDEKRLVDLCEAWIGFKKDKLDAGELSKRSFDEYFAICTFVMEIIDRQRFAADIGPDDFQVIRRAIAKRYGIYARTKRIVQVRSLFRYGYKSKILEKPADFGLSFEIPKAVKMREHRLAKGRQDFTREEIHAMLKIAKPTMRAMILLAVNAGLGNTDVGELPLSAIDIKTGWLNYPRAKTATLRRVPLWPETIAAIAAANKKRPDVESPYVFLSVRGNDYTDPHRTGWRVTGDFRQILKTIGIEDGRGFYAFRRTFQTQAEECGDIVAIQAVMGHAPSERDMSARYRQGGVSDKRLQAAVNTVRDWLKPIPAFKKAVAK